MVKVPKDLSGASLLGVHNWVKSNMALSNPGASPDYKLTDPSGNRLTLSDVARNAGGNVNIEVTTIQGVRKNPASNLTMIPGMDVKYPDMVRGGNNLTDLLPDEVDSAMATRIIAEQGLHRGLHTLNRMSLTTYNKHISSPTTAALLQMGELIKKNPSDRTPFTQRTPVHYGSEKALQTWLLDTSGADTVRIANTNVEDAKIAARYGLNTQDIGKFAQDVLSDYLFAASSNRGLVRTLIRNLPELRNKRDSSVKETIQKLIYMFPTQPHSFYEGSQRVFVASTAFMYPAYAESLLSVKEMKAIVKFAQGYPRNMGRTDTVPAALKKLTRTAMISPMRDWRVFLTQTFTRKREASDRSPLLDSEYSREGHLKTIITALAADPQDLLRNSDFRPLGFYSDLGGFYPSPPPKWPRKLMYAIMDGFLENLPHIINMEDHASVNLTPVQMAYFSKKEAATGKLKVRVFGKDHTKEITMVDALKITTHAVDPDEGAAREKSIEAFYKLGGMGVVYPKKARNKDENVLTAETIGHVQQSVRADIETHEAEGDVKTHTSNLSFEAGGPKSLLEMVYDIAEIATAKYDYNMRGDDFKFTMSVVHYSFKSLAEATQGSAFELTSNRISAGIENILGANKYRRLEELRESIQQNEFEGRPQAAYIQSIFLAKLYVIRDEMQKQLDAPLSTTAEAALRTSLGAQYRIILAGLDERELSPSFNAAAQGVLLEMRNLVEGE